MSIYPVASMTSGSAPRDTHDGALAITMLRRFVEHQTILIREKSDSASSTRLTEGRLSRAALLDLGRADEAKPLVELATTELHALKTPPAHIIYDLACSLAQLSTRTGPEPDRLALADRAVAEFSKAVHAGFGPISHFKADRDLDPLRTRADFQLILLDASFPGRPFAP